MIKATKKVEVYTFEDLKACKKMYTTNNEYIGVLFNKRIILSGRTGVGEFFKIKVPMLDKYSIKYIEKHMYEHDYLIVDKGFYNVVSEYEFHRKYEVEHHEQ